MVEKTFESKKLPEEFSEQVLEQLLIRNYGMGYDSGVDYHGLSGMVHLSSEKSGRKLTVRMRRAAASAIKDTNPGHNVIDSGQEYNELLARMSSYESFKEVLERFQVKVEKVILREGEDGECYAEVSLSSAGASPSHAELALVQMRPSDGLSLAYRFKAPVFATDALMQRKVIPEGRKGKLTKEEVETLLYGKPLSDLLWTRLRDIALEKPLSVEAGRAEAHIRLVTEGSEKKAIVENVEKVEVPLTEEQYQGLMKLATDWDEKVNKRGWSSGETKGHWWFAHQVTIKPDETTLTFAGKLLPTEEIEEKYKKLITECQEIVSLENRHSRLSETYRNWANYYLEAGDKEKTLATLQEGLREPGENAQIQAMIEETRSQSSIFNLQSKWLEFPKYREDLMPHLRHGLGKVTSPAMCSSPLAQL